MKASEIFESDIEKTHKMIKDRIKAHMETDRVISANHKWKFNVGDVFLSAKTGKTYEITYRKFQKRIDRDDNFKKIGDAYMSAVYGYKTADASGQFWEDTLAKSKDLKLISKGASK